MPTGPHSLLPTFRLAAAAARLARPTRSRFISSSTLAMSAPAPVNAAQPEQKYGWAISEKAAGELQDGKVDVWTVFSPASGTSAREWGRRSQLGTKRVMVQRNG